MGYKFEANVLEAALGVPVIPRTATRASGCKDLLRVIGEMLADQRVSMPRLPEIRSDHQGMLKEISRHILGYVPTSYPSDGQRLKLLEGDAEMTHAMRAALPTSNWEAVNAILVQHDDAFLAVASGCYEWIARMMRAAVVRPKAGQISLTERLDRWAAHPFWGLVILAGILGLVFWLTFTLGTPVQTWLATQVVSRLAGLTSARLINAPPWLHDLLVGGTIGGVGSVTTFLPIMIIFFATFLPCWKTPDTWRAPLT